MPTIPLPTCPAGLAVRTEPGSLPVHAGDKSTCYHTARPGRRPDGLPTEVMVGVDDTGHVALIDEDPDSVVAWLTHRGPNSRVFRAALTYRSETILASPVTVERPVLWS